MGMPRGKLFVDLTGRTFGRLTVGAYVGKQGQTHHWECQCECGVSIVVWGGDLNSGGTKSCGCLRKELAAERATTHGHSRTELYTCYINMLRRCYGGDDKSYDDYEGRGITVCDRWLNSLEDFLADMGARPSPEHSIDRVDNDKGYSPDNCRWATKREQVINRRIPKNNTSGVKGVYWYKAGQKWRAQINIDGKQTSLGGFPNKDEAIAARRRAEQKYYHVSK